MLNLKNDALPNVSINALKYFTNCKTGEYEGTKDVRTN